MPAISQLRAVGYLSNILANFGRALDFPLGVVPLHGAPAGNPWRVPRLDVARPQGNIHSEVELLVFMFGLVLIRKPRLVIETGADVGVMTRTLGAAVAANGFGRVLAAEIDRAKAEIAGNFCQGLPVEVRTAHALTLPIEDADLLFIDSGWASRVEELKLVRPGALAVVHDTTREPAMGDLARRFRHVEVVTPRGFCVVQKNG